MDNKGFDENDDIKVSKKHDEEKNNNDGNGGEVTITSTTSQCHINIGSGGLLARAPSSEVSPEGPLHCVLRHKYFHKKCKLKFQIF